MMIPDGVPRAPPSMREMAHELGWPPPSKYTHVPPLAQWPPNVPGPSIGFQAGNVIQNLFAAAPTKGPPG